MGYAVEIFFDDASESRIASLWDDFAGFGAPSMMADGSRPHISLAVADSVDLTATRQLLDDFASAIQPFQISLASLGFFLSNEWVAHLAPKVTPALLTLHEQFFCRFSSIASGVWQIYSPATWVPHCTLAMGLPGEMLVPALEACQRFALPMDCTATEIGLVEFRPVKQVHAVHFGR